jgi:adenylate cyclase class 2
VERLEIEVKIRFAGPEEARRAIARAGGVERRSRHFEDNRVLDTPGGDLAVREALLRVRGTSDGGGILTFKEKVPSTARAKVRSEWEVEVSSPELLAWILSRAGFVTTYRYQKYRTVFELEGAVIDLDETPMGCFVEIEAPAEVLAGLASRLGAKEEEMLTEDYRALFMKWLEERGLPPADMIFADGGPGRLPTP